jgi:hypothetical protein
MRKSYLFCTLFLPALILLVPLLAMQWTVKVSWTALGFAIAYALLAGAGLIFGLVARLANNRANCAAIGLAVGTSLLMVWGNLAVGFIGNEKNPANLLYGGVLAIGIVGGLVTRFRPSGMVPVLFAMAAAQALVPIVALLIWQPHDSMEMLRVLGPNSIFAGLFALSAILFRFSASRRVGEG